MSDLRKAAEMALEALDCLPWQASPIAVEATKALRTALAQPEQDLAYQEAKLLAQNLYKRHYQDDKHYVSGHVVWKPLDTTVGVITQIDNMVSGLVRPQPKQECIYPECETGIGCDGPCGQKPVDTVNTSQECVDEMGKRGHEPGVCQHSRYSVDVHEQTGNCYDCGAAGRMKFVVDDTAPPKREWKGLTDEEIEDEHQGLMATYIEEVDPEYWSNCDFEFARAIEAKLREKNT